VNDAFDETLAEAVDGQDLSADRDVSGSAVVSSGDDYYGGADVDISAALDSQTSDGTNALHSGSVTTVETTTNAVTFGATTDSGVAVVSQMDDITDCGKDPFDTSEFDSAAFDAFATKFDSTSGAGTADNSTASYDPFASPLRSAKKAATTATTAADDSTEADVFDIFDPYASRSAIKAPKNTPAKSIKDTQKDSFDEYGEDSDNLRIVIRAKMKENIGDSKGPQLGQ
jgi:hypothetical protein